MGRPATRSGHVVAVSIDGKGGAWCDGVFAGDSDIVTYAARAARAQMPVPFGNATYTAGADDALAALMALIAYSPGRAVIAEAPADVQAILADGFDPDPTTIYDTPEG